MEAQTLQYIDLDSIIFDYLGASEQSDHRYKKCFDIAYRGMDQMGLDFFYKIKSVKLPVLGTKVAQLPADCLQWLKAGYFTFSGGVVPMAYNSNRSSFAGLLPNRLALTQSLTGLGGYDPYGSAFCNYYGSDGMLGNIYGTPAGEPYVGKFIVAEGYIELDPWFLPTHICLEYISNPGESTGGTYTVPVQFREALIAWIGWQDIALLPPSRRGSIGDKESRKANFFNERRLANARYKPFRLDQEYLWNLENQRLCIKV